MGKLKHTFNIFDLNFVLCFCGFTIFTTFVDNSLGSIIYRGVTLTISVICLLIAGVNFGKNTALKIFIISFAIIVIKITIDYIFIGVPSSYQKAANNTLLFAYGVSFIPTLSVIGSWERIHTKTCVTLIFLSLFLILGSEYIKHGGESSTVRVDLNDRQSTLTFGDNGAYLVIISLAIVSRLKNDKYKLTSLVLAILGIIIGFFSIGRAASRGPLLGCIAAFIYIAFNSTKFIKLVLIGLLLTASMSIVAFLNYLESSAPVLYSRILLSIEEMDTSGRDKIFEDGFKILEDSPIIGGNPVILMNNGEFTSFHNCYLDIAIGTGVIGGLIFIILILSLAINSIKLRKEMTTTWDLLVMGMLWFFIFRSLSGVSIIENITYDICIVTTMVIIHRKSKEKYERTVNSEKICLDNNS